MNPKVKLMGGWFKYEKEFEEAEKKDKRGAIFTVHYENLKKNPIHEARRLADFLNIDLRQEDIAEIVDKCSFQKLKQADETVKDQSVFKESGLPTTLINNLYRKGEIGDWKNHFTVAMNEQFDAVFKEEMRDSDIDIQFE
ncbi:sulfotransferase 1C2-like [Crassostrea virginica]